MKHQQSHFVLSAASLNPDLEKALLEISEVAKAFKESYVILFYSNSHSASEIEKLVPRILGNHCVGCSTAGEIGTKGYTDNGLSAIIFNREHFLFSPLFFDRISKHQENLHEGFGKLKTAIQEDKIKLGTSSESFIVTLIDGLSVQEETLVGQLGTAIVGIPVVGGSAGDGVEFKKTTVFYDGKVHTDCALFLGVTTKLPFRIFKTQHFNETNKKVVITSSNPETRVVYEIDGSPAADAYADVLNLKKENFSPQIFSQYPIMMMIGDEYYVRSIQKVNPDGSMTFFCAIDDGLVMTIANKEDLRTKTEEEFKKVCNELGEVEAILGFECILRKLEVNSFPQAKRDELVSLYRKYNVVGFHTYGEQIGSIHVNQTFSGVAFGKPNRSAA